MATTKGSAEKQLVKSRKLSSNKNEKEDMTSTDISRMTDYSIGGIASCIGQSESSNKVKVKKKKKLSKLFGQAQQQLSVKPIFSPLIQLPTKVTGQAEQERGMKRKTIKVEQNEIMQSKSKKGDSEILFKREEGFRNADQTAPKKKKRKKILNEIDEVDIPAKQMKTDKPADPELDKRTIFVGNLPVDISKKELMKLFKKYGEIDSLRLRSAAPSTLGLSRKVVMIKEDFHPDKKSLNAYVVYKEEISVQKALKRNGKVVRGHHIRVDISSDASKHDHKRSVFIGNLPYKIDEEIVRQHFEQCGTVMAVRLVRDSKTGIGKGFGYVLYEDRSSVEFALKFNDQLLVGRKLRVKRSFEKEKEKPGNIAGGKYKIQGRAWDTGKHKMQRPAVGKHKMAQPGGGKHTIQQPVAGKHKLQQSDGGKHTIQQPAGRKLVYKGTKAKQKIKKKRKL